MATIGDNELAAGAVRLKNMETGEQREIPLTTAGEAIERQEVRAQMSELSGRLEAHDAVRRRAHRRSWTGRVTLMGWAHRGTPGWVGLIFLALRDRNGLVQVVFDEEDDAALFARADSAAQRIRRLAVGGAWSARPGRAGSQPQYRLPARWRSEPRKSRSSAKADTPPI